MAQQPQPQYEFHYQRVELLKTESLGIGSYGAVCKAMCDDLPCAAKILHPTLFQFTAPGSTSVMQKFEQECRLLSAIKHPHIVQYLGTYHDPESRLPVLLMELMDESLTRFLERSHEPLPYHIEVNLCHDIALALSYLHSNGIVHRDLSSNNVLLIAGSRAKVTDFGMAKLYDVNRSTAHLTPLTVCPGTLAYMSPEALGEPPVYTDKLDSFSVGVIGIQIMTRQFPDPGNRFKIIEINDPRIPSGTVQVNVPEIKRRRSHINLIDPAHPLLPVALDCLKDRDRERPSCHELCGRISTLKASPKYTESVQQSQLNTKPTQSGNRESREREIQQSQQIQDFQQQLHTQSDQLQEREQEIQQQQQQILRLHTVLTVKDDQLQTLQQELTTKDKQLVVKAKQLADKDDQLQQKEAATAAHQQEIQQLRQQLEKVVAEKHLLEKERSCLDTPTKPPEASWRGRKTAVPNGVSSISEMVASAGDKMEEEYSLISETRKVISTSAKGRAQSPTPPPPVGNMYNVTSHVEASRKRQFRTPPPIPTTAAESAGMEEYALLDRPEKPKKTVSSSLPSEPYSMLDIPDEPPTLPNQHPTALERPQAKARRVKSGDHHGHNPRDKSAPTTQNSGETGHKPGVTPLAFQRPPIPKPRQRQRAKPPTKGANSSSQTPDPHSHSAGPDSHSSTSRSAHGEVEQVARAPVRCIPPQDNSSLEEVGYKTWRTFSPPPDVSEDMGQEEAMGDAAYMSGDDVINSDEADSKVRNARIDVTQCDTTEALYIKEEVNLATVKRTLVVKDGYCDIELPDESPPDKMVDLMTVKRARTLLSYSEVDVSEPLLKDANLSTIKHAQAADGPDCNHVDISKPEEGQTLSSAERAPVTDRPGYYNVELPEQSPSKHKKNFLTVKVELSPPDESANLATVKHPSVVTDAHGYCDIDVPELSPPEDSENLSTVKHPPIVADARSYWDIGYWDIDIPELTPPDESANLTSVKHPSVVTDARGYCDIDVPELSPPEENLTTIEHPPIVTDARGYYDIDIPDLSPSEDDEKPTVKPAPVGPGGGEDDTPESPKPKPREKPWKKFMGKKRASVSSETEISTSSLSNKGPVQSHNQSESSPEKQGETASGKAKLRKLGPPWRKVPPPPIKPPHQQNNPAAVSVRAAAAAKSDLVEDVKQNSPGGKSKSPKQFATKAGKMFSRNKSKPIHNPKTSSSNKGGVPVLTRDDSDFVKDSPVQASPGLKKRTKGLFFKKGNRERDETAAKLVSPTAKTMCLPAKAHSQGKFIPPEQTADSDNAGIYSVIPEHENSVMSPQVSLGQRCHVFYFVGLSFLPDKMLPVVSKTGNFCSHYLF